VPYADIAQVLSLHCTQIIPIRSLGFQYGRVQQLAFLQRVTVGPGAAVAAHLQRVTAGSFEQHKETYNTCHATVFDAVANAGPNNAATTQGAYCSRGNRNTNAQEGEKEGEGGRQAHVLHGGGRHAAYVSH